MKGNFSIKKLIQNDIGHIIRADDNVSKNVIETKMDLNSDWVHPDHNISTELDRLKLIELAAVKYQNTVGQKMQAVAKDSFYHHAVLNLQEHHTVDDVLAVVDEINHNLKARLPTQKIKDKGTARERTTTRKNNEGLTPLQISIHRDEGHFKDDNGITFSPGINCFEGRGAETDKWFYDTDRKNEIIGINDSHFKANYHAHLVYTRFDFKQGKKAILLKSDMQMQHKISAKVLGLEQPETRAEKKDKNQPLTVGQVKDQYQAVRTAQILGIGLEPETYKFNENRDVQPAQNPTPTPAPMPEPKQVHPLTPKLEPEIMTKPIKKDDDVAAADNSNELAKIERDKQAQINKKRNSLTPREHKKRNKFNVLAQRKIIATDLHIPPIPPQDPIEEQKQEMAKTNKAIKMLRAQYSDLTRPDEYNDFDRLELERLDKQRQAQNEALKAQQTPPVKQTQTPGRKPQM